MSFFQWTEDLDIHVPEMNSEHQELIRLMNHIQELNDQKASKESITSAAHALAAYTERHFENEEAYMKRIGYPGLSDHKKIHGILLDQVKQHIDEFVASTEPEMNEAFFGFLQSWLKVHIKGVDADYGKSP